MKLIIMGTPKYHNYFDFTRKLTKILERLDIEKPEILTGTNQGIEALAKKYAEDNNLSYQLYEIEWKKEGKRAAFLRNEKMINDAKKAIIFNDNKDMGTREFINQCKDMDLPSVILNIVINDGEENG